MHILVIEDDQRVAQLIKRGLEESEYSATVAYDGATGKKLAFVQDFDLIITDIILPKLSGLDLCREIRDAKPDIPIIMLTALGTTDDKVEGFDSGADDYLVKPFDFRELQARIRALMKRKKGVGSASVLKYNDLQLDLNTKTAQRNGQEITLTPKEFRLLEYMIRHNERVLSRGEISEKVWDSPFDTGTNFIDVYINYLRKKIDRNSPTKLIHTKSGMGFILKALNDNQK